MTIERIAFEYDDFAYNPLEASIHVARYQIAKQFVSGKQVLDIACGEGYGSLLLKQWGAASVTGVDIDQGAINSAAKHFLLDGITFICGNAETIDSDVRFELIISLETIEHVQDEYAYLNRLKSLLAENGVLIISCPNDHWYYNAQESNRYHLRKYTFKDFVNACEPVLGKASTWLLGANVFGYGNFVYQPDNDQIAWSKAGLSIMDMTSLLDSDVSVSYNNPENLPTAANSLYYVGIWGLSKIILTSNIFPISPIKPNIHHLAHIEEACATLQRDRVDHLKYIKELEESRKQLLEIIEVKDAYIKELVAAR